MQNTDIIKEYIYKEIIKSDSDEDRLQLENDINLIENGIMDSFGLVNLIIYIEEAFKINILGENVNFNDFQSINSICTQIDQKQNRML